MLPVIEDDLTEEYEVEEQSDLTFKMNMTEEEESISGIVEGIESVKQAVYNILNTERYEYLAFPFDYGVELSDLVGRSLDYVIAEIERRIPDALLQDDRITGVDDFNYDMQKKGELLCSFTVHSVYGDAQESKEVEI